MHAINMAEQQMCWTFILISRANGHNSIVDNQHFDKLKNNNLCKRWPHIIHRFFSDHSPVQQPSPFAIPFAIHFNLYQ